MKVIDVEEFAQICFDIEKDQEGQGNYDNALFASELGKMISTYPTIDAAPVKHGQWIHCKGESSIWYCSVCGEKIIYNPTRKTYKPSKKPVNEINKYCRNCGAMMGVEGQDAKEET